MKHKHCALIRTLEEWYWVLSIIDGKKSSFHLFYLPFSSPRLKDEKLYKSYSKIFDKAKKIL